MDAKTDNRKGSWVRYWVNRSYKIPVAGYVIRILTAILNLPQIVRNINEYQAFADARFAGKADREAAEDAHSLDAMYMSFEDRFRGTRAEIERKLRVYLPLIHALGPLKNGLFGHSGLDPVSSTGQAPESRECMKTLDPGFRRNDKGSRNDKSDVATELVKGLTPGSKKEVLSILDVGCGRGEWLELLREEGYRAGGIDINRAAVQQCRGRGLDVTESDVIDHLRGLDRGSLDVVTGFHIIEHLPFPTMVALFDEAFAVLKSGGMIILETPNPTNILVSAYDFYRDPGHIRPLHPETVNFIAENRGFVRTGSYFVSDAGSDGTFIKSTEWKLADINDYIRAPRDFALIGYKP